jgi:hypothetical protein
MSFALLADDRFIHAAKAHVDELRWAHDAGDLRAPIPSNIGEILEQLPRRGLDPMFVGRLLARFPARPLERALLAWDVLHGSLLGGQDEELLARLSTELAPLKRLGTLGSVAIPRDRISTVIEMARSSSDDHEIPCLARLASSSAPPAVVDATLKYAKRLSRAHLPSLALAFLQILWSRFAVQDALDLLIEIALDFQQLDAIPEIDAQDDVSLQRKAYGLLRARLALGDLDGAVTLNEAIERVAATRDSSDPSLLLARVELAIARNQQIAPTTTKVIEALAPPDSGWRYAVCIRDALTLQNRPDAAVQVMGRFIARFGNRTEVWRRAAPHARDELLPWLSREIRYLSHDPEVWRALAIFASDDSIANDVDQRLLVQSSGELVRPIARWKRYGFAKDPK